MRTVKLPLTIAQHEQIKAECAKNNFTQSALTKYIFIMGAQQYFKPIEAVASETEPADMVTGD